MRTKEELVKKYLLDIISTCGSIAKLNPRVANTTTNTMSKQVRNFARACEKMEDSEIMEMTKNFFSDYYLDAMEDDSVDDWLDHEAHLKLGEGECLIKFSIEYYFRIAKDVDTERKTKWRNQLKYDVIGLLKCFGSEAIQEKLGEKYKELEAKLGKTSSSSTASSASASNLPTSLGGIGDMFTNMFTTINQQINSSGGPSMKEMMKNPQARKLIEQVAGVAPPEFQDTMKSALSDLSEGKLDMGKTLGDIFSKMGSFVPDDSQPTGEDSPTIKQLSDSDHHIDLAEASTSNTQSSDTNHEPHCDGDVCFIPN